MPSICWCPSCARAMAWACRVLGMISCLFLISRLSRSWVSSQIFPYIPLLWSVVFPFLCLLSRMGPSSASLLVTVLDFLQGDCRYELLHYFVHPDLLVLLFCLNSHLLSLLHCEVGQDGVQVSGPIVARVLVTQDVLDLELKHPQSSSVSFDSV